MKGIKIALLAIVLMVCLQGFEQQAEAHSNFSFGFSYHHPGYYYPYRSYYRGPYWGYGYSYYAPYAYGPYYGYPYYYYFGEIRLEVKPQTAKVYVNGDYVGVVDDFDGWWQKLRLEPGTYRIVVREQGFAPLVENIRVLPGRDYHIERHMQPGQDVIAEQEMRPPRQEREYTPPRRYRGPRDYDRDDDYRDDNGADSQFQRRNYEGENEEAPSQEALEESPGTHKLIVQVRPTDATIYVDGNYYGTADFQGTGEVQILLPDGMHRIEIVRPGYESFVRDINMDDMANERLEVNLEKK